MANKADPLEWLRDLLDQMKAANEALALAPSKDALCEHRNTYKRQCLDCGSDLTEQFMTEDLQRAKDLLKNGRDGK